MLPISFLSKIFKISGDKSVSLIQPISPPLFELLAILYFIAAVLKSLLLIYNLILLYLFSKSSFTSTSKRISDKFNHIFGI